MFNMFSSKNKELEEIIKSLEANRSNNYKDNAQSCLKELKSRYSELIGSNKLNSKQEKYYSSLIKSYEETMTGYSHKEQTPYWT